MDARKLRLHAGGGPLVAVQSSIAGAEELKPLTAARHEPRGYEWSATAQNVVPIGALNESHMVRPRIPAMVWVAAVATAAAAVCVSLIMWFEQPGSSSAGQRAGALQTIADVAAFLTTPLQAATVRQIEGPAEEWAGLATVPIEPSRLPNSLNRMPAPVQAPVNGASAEARSATAAKNTGTSLASLASDLARKEATALAAASAHLHADAGGGQKLDATLLIARGDEFLRHSDVTSARLFYKLAASNGSAAGAIAMGSTYDPIFLERNAVRGVKPEPGRALAWYKAAAELGDAGAKARSTQLLDALRRDAARGDPEAKAILDGAMR